MRHDKYNGSYLDFYRQCMNTGRTPDGGLCRTFHDHEFFRLIDPDDGGWNYYWGYDGELSLHTGIEEMSLAYEFTPIRQNVVLLMAAMNGEL